MKTILLHANKDIGQESRIQAALDLARAAEAHITCCQAILTPVLIADGEMAGMSVANLSAQLIEEYNQRGRENRHAVEARLRQEDVSWDWIDRHGDATQILLDQMLLVDAAVVSLASDTVDQGEQLSLAAGLAVRGGAPVVAVPVKAAGFQAAGPALVAWNGSAESAHALRQNIELLRLASSVTIMGVGRSGDLPAESAATYLSRHNISADIQYRPADGDAAAVLLTAARELGASYILMGAYGHSRMLEFLLGGVTRALLMNDKTPLVLTH